MADPVDTQDGGRAPRLGLTVDEGTQSHLVAADAVLQGECRGRHGHWPSQYG
jgi:hypothetical protein